MSRGFAFIVGSAALPSCLWARGGLPSVLATGVRWVCKAFWGALAVLLFADVAESQSRPTFLLGNEASLSGGAVTANVRDGGAAWYNPAGLGANQRNQLDLSASALVLRRRHLRNGIVTLTPNGDAQSVDLDDTEADIKAPSLAFVRELKEGLSAALSFFVTIDENARLRGEARDEDGTVAAFDRIGVDTSGSNYYIGPSVGWQPTSHLRVGASLFVTYETSALSTFSGASVVDQADGEELGGLSVVVADATRIALAPVAGLQWQPIAPLHLGLNIKVPELRVFESTRGDVVALNASRASDGEGAVDFASADLGEGGSIGIVRPGVLTLGAALEVPRGWVSLEADVSHPLKNRATFINEDWAWNVRTGFRYRVRPEWHIGAGLFTNLNATPSLEQPLDRKVNRLGASSGVTYLREVKLADAEDANTLVFSTTVALSYAVGFGKGLPLVADLRNLDEELPVDVPRARVLEHDTSLYIGSGIRF